MLLVIVTKKCVPQEFDHYLTIFITLMSMSSIYLNRKSALFFILCSVVSFMSGSEVLFLLLK